MSIALGAGVECLLVETRAGKTFLQDTNEITFSDEDIEVGYSDHKRLLYLVASINQIPIKRALVDTGILVNPMEVIGLGEEVNIPQAISSYG